MIKKLNILVFMVFVAWLLGFQVSLAAETLFGVDSSTVALWRFNDGEGSFVKDETGINHGIAYGAAVVDGKFGKAREFSGSGQYIEIPNNNSLNNLTQITIESWIKPTGFDLECWNNNESIIAKGGGDEINAFSLRIWRNSDSGCAGANSFKNFYPSGNFGNGSVATDKLYSPGEWIYLVFAYDGDYMKLYVNGEVVSTQRYFGLIVNNTSPLLINKHFWRNGSSRGRIAGLIDEIRISNKARTVEEIKINYERGMGSKTKNPVVVIPGLMGSWFSKLDPILGTYNSLIQNLKNKGYTEKELFTFPYDWRSDNRVTAQKFAEKIGEIKSICNCNKVDVIAHSMGGLIAREYIASDYYGDDLGQLILMGAPHRGSLDAYSIWESGEENVSKITIKEKLLDILAAPTGLSRWEFIRSEISSIKQLLPTFNYLKSDGIELSYPSGYPINEFLDETSGLNSLENVVGLLNKTDKLVNVVGRIGQNSTPRYFEIESRPDKLPFWEHGFPVRIDKENGDGVVSLTGSEIMADDYVEIESAHRKLPIYAWSSIEKFFEGEDNPVPLPNAFGTLLIAVHSPVDFSVLDPNGRVVGKDLYSTSRENIPGGFYSGFDNPEIEFVTIPNPLPGQYRVVIQGTGDGAYEVEASFFDENELEYASGTFTAQTRTNVIEELKFEFQDSDKVEILPEDRAAPITQISTEGKKGLNEWFVDDVKIFLSAEDEGVGVFKTEYSLDGEKTWTEYKGPFVLGEGKNLISFRSEDLVGNREDVKRIAVNVDKSAPEVSIYLDKTNKDIMVEGLDVSSTTVLKNNIGFEIQNEAGHITRIAVPEFKKRGKEIKGLIASVSYNNDPAIPTNVNLKYEWSEEKGGLIKTLNQRLNFENSNLQANFSNGFTRMISPKAGHIQGLLIFKIRSEKGKILNDGNIL